ncbi:MAG: transcriptional regulator [Proteobacteria bacterium]|nr:MAG: transcriptional regulator [Pseudomonadota bacterium]
MAVDKSLLPEIGFVRLPTILAHVPVSRSLWWEGVRTGRFPKPVKLAPRVTAWRVEDVRSVILTLGRKT